RGARRRIACRIERRGAARPQRGRVAPRGEGGPRAAGTRPGTRRKRRLRVTMDSSDIRSPIAGRAEQLHRTGAPLKTELSGSDATTDRVLDAIRAWYVLPELVQRPVIVCLWGLTGTGKTQLVRSLAQKLDFYDRFVEVQMDGFSNGSGHWRS